MNADLVTVITCTALTLIGMISAGIIITLAAIGLAVIRQQRRIIR